MPPARHRESATPDRLDPGRRRRPDQSSAALAQPRGRRSRGAHGRERRRGARAARSRRAPTSCCSTSSCRRWTASRCSSASRPMRACATSPVIMVSGLDDFANVVHCIEAGAEDYLPKPFDRDPAARAHRRRPQQAPHPRVGARARARRVRALPARVDGRPGARERRERRAAGRRAAREHGALHRPARLHGLCRDHAARPGDRRAQPLLRRDGRRDPRQRRHARRVPRRWPARRVRGAGRIGRPRRSRAARGARDAARAAPALQRLVARERARRRLRDRHRDRERPADVGQRRLGAPTGVHGGGRHGQHGLAARGADQGIPAFAARLRLDQGAADAIPTASSCSWTR